MKNYMEELYPFFNPSCDGGAQGVYLKELGSKEVQRGICLHLVLAWFHLYKKDSSKLPNVIWQEMKSPGLIKQIANNHRAYIQAFSKIQNGNTPNFTLIEENVSAYMNINVMRERETVQYHELETKVIEHLNLSNMQLLGVRMTKDNVHAGHALGLIKHSDGFFYLFDPNVGVLKTDAANLGNLLNAIYRYYGRCNWELNVVTIYNIV